MPRTYRGHYLNPEQQKLAADNLPLVWWYIDKKLLKYGKIAPHEIDDVAGHLIWHLCMAAEGFDPSKGYKFSTYAKIAFNGGAFRYKQLKTIWEQRYIITDFVPTKQPDGDNIVVEPTYYPHPPKFVNWEDISWLFDLINMTPIEKQIVRFYYEFRYTFADIADLISLSRERIRQIHDSMVEKIKKHLEGSDIKASDFYVEKC